MNTFIIQISPYLLLKENDKLLHMNHVLKHAIGIVAAMTGSALLLVGIISLVHTLTIYDTEPSDFIDTNQILALLHTPSKRLLEEFSPLPPIEIQDATAIALFPTETTNHAVTFSKNKTGTEPTVGMYNIKSTNTDLLPLITQQDSPLRKDKQYILLANEYAKNDSWAYVSATDIPKNTTFLSAILRALLRNGNNVFAFSYTENGIETKYEDQNLPIGQEVHLQMPTLSGAYIQMTMANAEQSLTSLLHNLDTNNTYIMQGILGTLVSYLGDDISMQYDVLPLLNAPASLQVATNNEGTDLILSGSVQNAQQLARTLQKMHTSYAATLPSSAISKRTLSAQFYATDIRFDPQNIAQETSVYNGWHVQRTMQKDEIHGLVTATNMNQFLISKTDEALLQAIDGKWNEVPAGKAKIIVETAAALPYLSIMHDDAVSQFGTGTILITTQRKGVVRTTILQSLKNPLQLLDLIQK